MAWEGKGVDPGAAERDESGSVPYFLAKNTPTSGPSTTRQQRLERPPFRCRQERPNATSRIPSDRFRGG